MMDVRDLPGAHEQRWVKVQGAAGGAEIRVSGQIRHVFFERKETDENDGAVVAELSVSESLAGLEPLECKSVKEDHEAGYFTIGEGEDRFVITLSIEKIGGSGSGLLLPGADMGGMWISYRLFSVVAQTERFEELQQGCEPTRDIFRVQSVGSGHDILDWFLQGEQRYFSLYLCTVNRIIAWADVDLTVFLFGNRAPADMHPGVFPLEAQGRFEMDSWEEDPDVMPAQGGAWVDLKLSLAKEEGVAAAPRSNTVSEGLAGEEGEEEYSDDFISEMTSPTKPAVRDVTVEDWEGKVLRMPLERIESSFQAGDEEGMSVPAVPGTGTAAFVKEDETPTTSQAKPDAAPLRLHRSKPPGIRRFRLSIDLRSIRDLKHSQHVYCYYHYPFLGGEKGGGATTLDNPVLSAPVWVPAVTETPMSNSCCQFYFSSTYADLEDLARRNPFLVSIRTKEGPGGGGGELGKVRLLFEELVKMAPVHYRDPIKLRIFKSYETCSETIAGQVAQGEAPPDACPVILYIIDQSLPILGKEGLGGAIGSCPSLRTVMVLEDMGPEQARLQALRPQAQSPFRAPVYQTAGMEEGGVPPPGNIKTAPSINPPPPPPIIAGYDMLELEKRRLEWEDWRQKEVSGKWGR